LATVWTGFRSTLRRRCCTLRDVHWNDSASPRHEDDRWSAFERVASGLFSLVLAGATLLVAVFASFGCQESVGCSSSPHDLPHLIAWASVIAGAAAAWAWICCAFFPTTRAATYGVIATGVFVGGIALALGVLSW
jgi:hypothetical protein